MLARIILLPNPLTLGGFVTGPPVSSQSSTSLPSLNCQLSCNFPDIDDSAPYFAAFVASSCSASAKVCADEGCKRTSGPAVLIFSALPTRYGANSSSIRPRRSAPCQRDCDRIV